MEWMILPLKRYAEFSGRSRRLEYWMFALLNLIVFAVLTALLFMGGLSTSALENPEAGLPPFNAFFIVIAIVMAAWVIAIFVPSIAVVVRRLHDRDMSGWWYAGLIVVSFVPFVGFIASIAFLVLMLLPGTPGPNRYGPDPKDPTSAAVFA